MIDLVVHQVALIAELDRAVPNYAIVRSEAIRCSRSDDLPPSTEATTRARIWWWTD